MLHSFGQYHTEIDGLAIHFLHIRSRHDNAMPMIMTHGWPGSVIEFHKVIAPLTDPTTYGGSESDAFHLVAVWRMGVSHH
jgi:epoxide hydrolase